MEKLIKLLDKIYKEDNTKDGAKFFSDKLNSKEIDVHFKNDTILKYAISWSDKKLTDMLVKEYNCDLYKIGYGYPRGENIKACVNLDDFNDHDYEFLIYLLENYVDFSTVNKDIMKELILNALFDRCECYEDEKILEGTDNVIKYIMTHIETLEITVSDVFNDFVSSWDLAVIAVKYLYENKYLSLSKNINDIIDNCRNDDELYYILKVSNILKKDMNLSSLYQRMGKIVLKMICESDSLFIHLTSYTDELLRLMKEEKKAVCTHQLGGKSTLWQNPDGSVSCSECGKVFRQSEN